MLTLITFLVNLVALSPARAQRIIANLELRVQNSMGLRAAIVNALNDDLDKLETL